MSDQNPYEKLGVTEDASFEEIQDAKGRLMHQHQGNQQLVETVEAAYDAIIMDRLRMRQEGKIKVPERIRFPERLSQAPPSFPQAQISRSPAWLEGFLDTPSTGDILWPAVIFLLLSLLIVPNNQESILPLTLALGFGCNIYFLNRKEQKFGRSVLLTLAGLLVGVGLGSFLGTYVGGIEQLKFATVMTFVIFWLISSFLR
ncbi:MAG: molecular chaperone DnaJ [Symploca sp. SIO1B1]|nr:molecular chaperone DnaJ [Symploca sp. SIO2D2]NER20622.1 molecular chaperone DnaJ [Symploca sp. SIO1C2]NER46205.1 molecular chaperone DnaJ [Symploca sp. SIO1A3]NER95828.1 molecular chaperone DnaJ [Symploca sp. SIO1B1]